jgi:type I restriction enzyme S subunit
MMEVWAEIEFTKSILRNAIGRNNQINASEILESGKYPVIDQGQSFIAGYTNDAERLIKDGFPYIVFGDHTRCFKYIDFPFVIGADGTKVLSPNTELFDPIFFFFQLLNLNIQNRGYNRHFKLLKEKILKIPPLPEQCKIAHVLSMVQKAIEQQDKLIKTTTELKKALIQKLFTEGLYGDHKITTDFGYSPESWKIQPFENTGEVVYGIQAAVAKNLKPIGNKILTNKNITLDGRIDLEKLNYFELSTKRHFQTILRKGDLLFNWRSGSKEHVGKTAIFDLEDGEYTHSSFILRIRVNEKHDSVFLYYYLNFLRESGYYQKVQTYSINAKFNKSAINAMPIALPEKSEQIEIAKILAAIDTKLGNLYQKKKVTQDLFKTMLHELMTGQRRVDEINFENKQEELLMAAEPEIKYNK